MKHKKKINTLPREEVHSDFYKATPTEKPLIGNPVGNAQPQRTNQNSLRHQKAGKFRKKESDIRDKKALEAILRFATLSLLLLIILIMLMRGIGLYEKRMTLDNEKLIKGLTAKSGTASTSVLVNDFDLAKEIDSKKFIEHAKNWQKAEQILRSGDALADQGIYDKAALKYQEVLQLIPSHMKALEKLGDLYTQQTDKDYVKAINIYRHLLDISPDRLELQKKLIEALSNTDKTKATIFMAKHYLDTQLYDSDIQYFMANAYYIDGDYENAIKAYKHILLNDSKNKLVLESISVSYIQLKKFSLALHYLKQLTENFESNEAYYLQTALCYAQLKNGKEAVKTLSRAAQIFDRTLVVNWVQDSLFDPIRNDRNFTMFIDRVAGIETRKKMELLVEQPDRKSKFSSAFSLMPENRNKNLLKTRK